MLPTAARYLRISHPFPFLHYPSHDDVWRYAFTLRTAAVNAIDFWIVYCTEPSAGHSGRNI